MIKNNQTYASALEELNLIVDSFNNQQIGMDELVKKVSRAKELLTYCRASLRKTESEVDSLLKDV